LPVTRCDLPVLRLKRPVDTLSATPPLEREGAIARDANTGRMRSFTISEAAEATGLTQKALRTRIAEGHVRTVLRDGMPPRIPESELRRAGLLSEPGEPESTNDSSPDGGSEIVRELVAVIERQAAELAALRARRSSEI
jgi:hypothetical protein